MPFNCIVMVPRLSKQDYVRQEPFQENMSLFPVTGISMVKQWEPVSCARMARADILSYGPSRNAGFYMVPRPDPYRPLFTTADGSIDTDAYIDFYEEFILEGTGK